MPFVDEVILMNSFQHASKYNGSSARDAIGLSFPAVLDSDYIAPRSANETYMMKVASRVAAAGYRWTSNAADTARAKTHCNLAFSVAFAGTSWPTLAETIYLAQATTNAGALRHWQLHLTAYGAGHKLEVYDANTTLQGTIYNPFKSSYGTPDRVDVCWDKADGSGEFLVLVNGVEEFSDSSFDAQNGAYYDLQIEFQGAFAASSPVYPTSTYFGSWAVAGNTSGDIVAATVIPEFFGKIVDNGRAISTSDCDKSGSTPGDSLKSGNWDDVDLGVSGYVVLDNTDSGAIYYPYPEDDKVDDPLAMRCAAVIYKANKFASYNVGLVYGRYDPATGVFTVAEDTWAGSSSAVFYHDHVLGAGTGYLPAEYERGVFGFSGYGLGASDDACCDNATVEFIMPEDEWTGESRKHPSNGMLVGQRRSVVNGACI
jgi:hypothetical protein